MKPVTLQTLTVWIIIPPDPSEFSKKNKPQPRHSPLSAPHFIGVSNKWVSPLQIGAEWRRSRRARGRMLPG